MPVRDFPNLGLHGGYDEHESGWGDAMNVNLLKLSALAQATALSKVNATPGSPVNGSVYIFGDTHPTQANKIAIYEGATGEESWTYVTPENGWLIFNQDEGYYEKFDGTVWAELETGGGGGSLPAGGTTGQVLGKLSGVDGDADWIDQTGGGGSGATATVNRAADLSFTVDQTGLDFSTINTVNFDKSDFDDFGAVSGSQFVVPVGVSRVEFQVKLWAANLVPGPTAFLNLTIYSPSRAVYIGAVNLPVGAPGKIMAVTLPSMEVVAGETFEVRIQGDTAQTNVQINANGTAFVMTDVSPITVGGGGGGGNPDAPWTVPVLADFTAVNLGTVTLADSPTGIGITFPAGNGFGVRGLMQAAPVTPWTVYAKVDFGLIGGENNARFGVAVRNISTDRVIQFGFQSYNNAQKQISRERWNGVNSYNGQNVGSYYEGDKQWIKLENDGTNLNMSLGDGYNWLPVATTTLAAFIGSVDEVGILIQSSLASLAVVNSFSFTPPA